MRDGDWEIRDEGLWLGDYVGACRVMGVGGRGCGLRIED